jgi:hypothetical protein
MIHPYYVIVKTTSLMRARKELSATTMTMGSSLRFQYQPSELGPFLNGRNPLTGGGEQASRFTLLTSKGLYLVDQAIAIGGPQDDFKPLSPVIIFLPLPSLQDLGMKELCPPIQFAVVVAKVVVSKNGAIGPTFWILLVMRLSSYPTTLSLQQEQIKFEDSRHRRSCLVLPVRALAIVQSTGWTNIKDLPKIVHGRLHVLFTSLQAKLYLVHIPIFQVAIIILDCPQLLDFVAAFSDDTPKIQLLMRSFKE